MSRLETAAKPILTPLILGQAAVISGNSARIIATWAAMKMMVTEFSRPHEVSSTQQERTHVMEKLEPAPNWNIWIGHVRSSKWRTTYFRSSCLLGILDDSGQPVAPEGSLGKNTQSILIGVGELLLMGVSSGVPGFTFQPPIDAQRHLRKVWPANGGFLWPPGTVFTEGAADLLAVGMNRFTRTLKWKARD